jgi:hypothetical protein
LNVADCGVGFEAAFLNQEIQIYREAFVESFLRGVEEETVHAEIQDAGDIVAAIAAPADP